MAAVSKKKVNPPEMKDAPQLPLKMIFLGVADELKGLPFLLRTLALAQDDLLRKIVLYVYAKGISHLSRRDTQIYKQIEYLKSKMAALFIYDGYRFDALPSILQGMHLGIVPPIWYDNAPQVVFEMLSMKVPILGSRIGGIPDFIRHGENGMLFETGCSTDFQDKLKNILMTPHLLEDFKHRIRPMKTIGEHAEELEMFYGLGKENLEN
jgi:glycosyltransferase involved in cell wall biosynthesis